MIPSGVAHHAAVQVETRHLARRKDGQHAALLQPTQAFLDGPHIDGHRSARAERIDKGADLRPGLLGILRAEKTEVVSGGGIGDQDSGAELATRAAGELTPIPP